MSFVSAAVGPGVVSSAVEPPGHEVAAENRLVIVILRSVAFLSLLRVHVPRRYDDGGALALQDSVCDWARVGSAVGPAHVGVEVSLGEAAEEKRSTYLPPRAVFGSKLILARGCENVAGKLRQEW